VHDRFWITDDGRLAFAGRVITDLDRMIANPDYTSPPWIDGRIVIDCDCGNRQSYRWETIERRVRDAAANGESTITV
jgi:hypothetical protein